MTPSSASSSNADVSSDEAGRSRRARVELEGTVQGVGFRPYVYRLATSLGLTGFVRNDSRGVLVEVEGASPRVAAFLERLPLDVPPLADVDRCDTTELEPTGAPGFRIVGSEDAGDASALVTPDSATCDDCLGELFDPGDRRHRYPFINCTNCGPRFTIVRGIPYDRPMTTMASFQMCEACRAEYEDPSDRRFHAQPNACPDCGPQVRLLDDTREELGSGSHRDPIAALAERLREGAIVAVKGLGGYHLACVADHEPTVAELRRRKHRYEKPFALMVPDVETAGRMVRLTDERLALLRSPAAPIVLAPRVSPGSAEDGTVAASVAPGLEELGVMLPYAPVHHLLLADVGRPLVMTSGNLSEEPIAFRDEEALDRLADVADLFLVNDRPIETRTDDSVVRTVPVAGRETRTLLRRSRGYVPVPLDLPVASPRPLVACGAQLKNTFCVVKGERAWVSHHVGDLENFETLRSFREGVAHFEELFEVEPELAVHDLHPSYLSTRFAVEETGIPTTAVQHHHAHMAACLAEHGRSRPALGVIYDGTGYGPDETVWGGEILLGGCAAFERVGHLWPCRLPGGEAAIREPWRMACAWLVEASPEDTRPPERLAGEVEPRRWDLVASMARAGTASPVTTSVGRLFDAVSALCGLRASVSYEGQAAIELEMAADDAEAEPYPLPVTDHRPRRLDARPLVRAVLGDLRRGVGTARVSSRFHASVAASSARVCEALAAERDVDTVVLSGGVFQNRLLTELTSRRLSSAGLEVLVPRLLPVNDGGIAYGQAAVAVARTTARERETFPDGSGTAG